MKKSKTRKKHRECSDRGNMVFQGGHIGSMRQLSKNTERRK